MAWSVRDKHRPLLLCMLAVTLGILGAAATGTGLSFIVMDYGTAPGPMRGFGMLFGAMLVVPGLFEMLLAGGLWMLKAWAWWLGVIAHSMSAVLVVITMISDNNQGQPLLISAGLLASVAVLLTPQVRRALQSAGLEPGLDRVDRVDSRGE
jgi:hypothetical protein